MFELQVCVQTQWTANPDFMETVTSQICYLLALTGGVVGIWHLPHARHWSNACHRSWNLHHRDVNVLVSSAVMGDELGDTNPISQEADHVVWYSHLFQNFPQFIVIHTVKGFGIVNKADKWALASLQAKLVEVIEFQLSCFKSWKMMLWKCCTQYASKFGKLSSTHRTGKGQFSFQSQKKAMPKNAQTTTQLHSLHTLVK